MCFFAPDAHNREYEELEEEILAVETLEEKPEGFKPQDQGDWRENTLEIEI